MSRRPGRKRERKLRRRRKRGLLSSGLGSFSPGERGSKTGGDEGIPGATSPVWGRDRSMSMLRFSSLVLPS
jgi:hypothetical protein